eukprot:scaffold148021_cov22-Prasinocladus_malaysianus.AAC.1
MLAAGGSPGCWTTTVLVRVYCVQARPRIGRRLDPKKHKPNNPPGYEYDGCTVYTTHYAARFFRRSAALLMGILWLFAWPVDSAMTKLA